MEKNIVTIWKNLTVNLNKLLSFKDTLKAFDGFLICKSMYILKVYSIHYIKIKHKS